MNNLIGGISVLAILGGLFFQNIVGTELAAILVIGGAIVGSLSAFVRVASWFKQ